MVPEVHPEFSNNPSRLGALAGVIGAPFALVINGIIGLAITALLQQNGAGYGYTMRIRKAMVWTNPSNTILRLYLGTQPAP